MSPARTKVFIADDHPLFLEAVARAIKARPDFELVGQAHDGRVALQEIQSHRPQVAVLDQNLPSLNGTAILQAIGRDGIPTRVVMLSADGSSSLVYDAVRLGVAAFLTKEASRTAICDAIAAVARGQTVLAPEIQTGLAGEVRVREDNHRPLLSEREGEVLALVARGMSAASISRELFISPSTVKTHLAHLYEKLGVTERAAAVAEAMRRGLLE